MPFLQDLPEAQCTYNLHHVVCQLMHQQERRGHASGHNELHVERSMHTARTSMHLAQNYYHNMCTDFSLDQLTNRT